MHYAAIGWQLGNISLLQFHIVKNIFFSAKYFLFRFFPLDYNGLTTNTLRSIFVK